MATLTQLIDNTGTPVITQAASTIAPIIEPLSGPLNISDVLDRFADTVYNTSTDAHLYKFLNSVVGDAGAGLLKKQAVLSRMTTESNLITFTDLDTLYSHSLQFPRLPDELYNGVDPDTDVLTPLEWDSISQADEKYLARSRQFLAGTRLGNSPAGISLIAESGCGVECDVVENYAARYDQLSDDPIGIAFQGRTNSIYEYIVTPRFKPTDDQAYQAQLSPQVVNEAPAWQPNTSYIVGDIVQPTDPTIQRFFQVTVAGTSGTTEPSWPETVLEIDPYNPTVLPVLQTVSQDGVTYKEIGVIIDEFWYSASGNNNGTPVATTTTYMAPAYERNMLGVLDWLRPVGALLTVLPTTEHFTDITESDGVTPINVMAEASSSSFTVSRFVTGAEQVNWPPTGTITGDRTQGYYIEAGIEKEAETLPFTNSNLPVIYHTIEGVTAYGDAALADPSYQTPGFHVASIYAKYISQHIGPYYSTISNIFPFLQNVPTDDIFTPTKAISLQSTPMILEGSAK